MNQNTTRDTGATTSTPVQAPAEKMSDLKKKILDYQEENGKLNRLLFQKRLGSFSIGIGMGILIAVAVYQFFQ